jgi:hypothetical protein
MTVIIVKEHILLLVIAFFSRPVLYKHRIFAHNSSKLLLIAGLRPLRIKIVAIELNI